jgi:hypothetical protein
MADQVLLCALGLAYHPTLAFLSARPDFESFAAWIVAEAGPPDPVAIERYHHWLDGKAPPAAAAERLKAVEDAPAALAAADLEQWEREGYVVLRNAIDREEAEAAAELLWRHLGATADDPESWYVDGARKIWTPVYHGAALDVARRSPRVLKAFAQLWGTADLWMIIDQMGFNPPERPGVTFQGSGLHWDVSLARPIPFGTQAMLYLTSTAADEGALRLVPRFHHRIADWLDAPWNTSPREVPLDAEAVAIPGEPGDLAIWRHDLPHGASPNRGVRPRVTQYLNMFSPAVTPHEKWY